MQFWNFENYWIVYGLLGAFVHSVALSHVDFCKVVLSIAIHFRPETTFKISDPNIVLLKWLGSSDDAEVGITHSGLPIMTTKKEWMSGSKVQLWPSGLSWAIWPASYQLYGCEPFQMWPRSGHQTIAQKYNSIDNSHRSTIDNNSNY